MNSVTLHFAFLAILGGRRRGGGGGVVVVVMAEKSIGSCVLDDRIIAPLN